MFLRHSPPLPQPECQSLTLYFLVHLEEQEEIVPFVVACSEYSSYSIKSRNLGSLRSGWWRVRFRKACSPMELSALVTLVADLARQGRVSVRVHTARCHRMVRTSRPPADISGGTFASSSCRGCGLIALLCCLNPGNNSYLLLTIEMPTPNLCSIHGANL